MFIMANITKHAQAINFFNRFKISIPSINGYIVLITSALVAITLFDAIPILSSYITSIFYLSILLLVFINWETSPYVRKALLFSSFLVLLSLIVSVFYPSYLNDLYLRGIFICLGIVTVASIKISSRVLKLQALVFAFILAVLFSRSFGYYDSYLSTNLLSDTADKTNPNVYSFIALISTLYLDRSFLAKNIWLKIILYIIAITTINNFSSRTGLLCLFIYLIVNFILKHYSKVSRKLIYLSVVIFAIIFPIVYVNMYENTYYANYSILGKDLYSGRQELWVLSKNVNTTKSVMFGQPNINLTELGSETNDWHNMYLKFWFSAGLVYSSILVFFIYFCFVVNNQINGKAFSYLIALLVFGFFETGLILGGVVAMAALLAFVNYDTSINKHKGRQLKEA
jgi:hypothetical protein